MLVLSRKVGEEIVVGDSIIFRLIEIRGDRVRIGIQAPKDVPVHRREVAELIGDAPQMKYTGPPKGRFCPDCGKRLAACRCPSGEAVGR